MLIVSHRRVQVTIVERSADRWTTREARAGDEIVVESLSLRVLVDELYAGIELEDKQS